MDKLSFDNQDIAILSELQQSARISLSELHTRVGMSIPGVTERIRKMEAKGIIRGFRALLDAKKLGLGLTAFISVAIDDPGSYTVFAEEVAKLAEVQECHHVVGEFDYLLKVKTADTASLESLISKKIRVIQGVGRTRTTVVLSSIREDIRLNLAPAVEGKAAPGGSKLAPVLHGESIPHGSSGSRDEGERNMSSKKIYILDVTNRDGVQTSRLGLSKLEKTVINMLLNGMGIAQSEFGFPFTRHEANYLNANLELSRMGVLKPIILSGWCTARIRDLEAGFQLVPSIRCLNISLSTSDQMIQGKFGGKLAWTDVVEMMKAAVSLAYERGAEFVAVNAEDSSRTALERLMEYGEAGIRVGAKRFRYCDTLGYDDPKTIYERVRKLAEILNIPIELHCHNDLGMAVANSVAGAQGAVDGGVDAYINTTLNGMGERAGNADLVSVLLAVKKASGLSGRYQLDETIDISHSWQIARYASYAFNVPIPVNQPAVGSNAFAHESGIHADGALKDRNNYELYHFEELGRGEPEIVETGRQITVGEYSGIKGFRNIFDRMEVEFQNDEEAAEILELVRYANVHNQKPLTQHELRFIARHPDAARKIMTVSP